MKNFQYFGGSLKNSIFRGGFMKSNIEWELPKKGGTWMVC